MRQADHTQGDAIIVAGPTCSGKSALAMRLAQDLDGVVINADSMQVYRELRVLTARPTARDEATCPHALYGVRAAADPGSVAWWRSAALAAMRDARAGGKLPILCGGSGLYFAALTDGLTDIPDPGAPARNTARALLAEIGPAALHDRLRRSDPATAAMLRPTDSQRLARAWEVLEGTGRGLAEWHRHARLPPAPARFTALLLSPPRAALRAAIGRRFEAMLRQGALAEVAALLALKLPPSWPAMRAHGVPELAAVLDGRCGLAEAGARAIQAQSRYTRRQSTWFAHHRLAAPGRTDIITSYMPGMTQESERIIQQSISFIQSGVDGLSSARP